MDTKLIVLAIYAVGTVLIGWLARTRQVSSPEGYFLAGRGLAPIIFLATMVATNLSAFTVFGASGAGYRDGYSFFPLVGFGTGFMALTFWILGRRIHQAGLTTGALTPPDLVRRTYGSTGLSALFAVVMVVYTLPYIALQPIAAGYALQALLGWDYFTGAAVVTGLIVLYTFRGGLRSVAFTDAFQGLLMLCLLTLALVVVAGQAGGLSQAGSEVLARHPELFSRPGGRGFHSPAIWFSFIFLWFFCDPMFPQLFQRFLAARDRAAIRTTMLAYPFVCSLAFILPVTIGVIGRLSHPGLTGKAADQILPLLAADLPGAVLGSLVVACGLAALMSTLDSQLLTLSSIFSQDLFPLGRGGKRPANAWPGRIFVLILAAAGLALAYDPPDTILSIASQTFTGLAVLFPTVFFGLSDNWRSTRGAWASIILGQTMVVMCFFKLLPTFGFLSVVPVMAVTLAAYLIAALTERRNFSGVVQALKSPWLYVFGALFAAAMDFWRWNTAPDLIWGWPSWVFYFLALSAVQTVLMWFWTRRDSR